MTGRMTSRDRKIGDKIQLTDNADDKLMDMIKKINSATTV